MAGKSENKVSVYVTEAMRVKYPHLSPKEIVKVALDLAMDAVEVPEVVRRKWPTLSDREIIERLLARAASALSV